MRSALTMLGVFIGVAALIAMVAMGDGASAAVKMRTYVYPKRVVLELVPGRGGAELEAWSLKKEADYFREVFDRDLAVEVA